jgi:Fe2+ transport system protein B
LCQFTEREIEIAKKMVGKGYPIEPTSILLNMPFALGYLLLMGIAFIVIFGLLLQALLGAFVQAYTEPSKALLYEINPQFRANIDRQFEELYIPYEEAANREIAKTNIARSENTQLTENSSQMRYKINSQERLFLKNNRTLQEEQDQISIVKNEYSKIVEHCVDQFISESYRREAYLNKLREFLTNPVSRQFQDFTGLAPTDETLRKIEAAEKKELEWEEMDEEEEH